MPIHDWKRVEAGIFQHFHHSWIAEIHHALNGELLPPDYYAMAERQTAGFGPDVLSCPKASRFEEDSGNVLLAQPRQRPTAETVGEFYRRRKSTIVVRHVSDDRIVAVVDVISPANKDSRNAFRALIAKGCQLLEHRIHLMLLDLFLPTKRDPHGLHAALWDEIADEQFEPPTGKPLTVAAYECALTTKAYVQPLAVGDVLPDMPLFLEPDGCVHVPLEATYQAAFAQVPRRWRRILEAAPSA